jgi:hypothetical protein
MESGGVGFGCVAAWANYERGSMMRTRFLALAGVFVLLTAAVTYGAPSIKTDIPFPFTVSGKVLPAGNYSFVVNNDSRTIAVAGTGQSSAVELVLNRLAAGIHTTSGDAHVVFDKEGNNYFLSEIWIPGLDGFELRTAKEDHQHQIINVPTGGK